MKKRQSLQQVVLGKLDSCMQKNEIRGFPGGAVVGNPPANAGDMGSSPFREDPTCRRAAMPVCHSC